MNLSSQLDRLGPGAIVSYIGQEGGIWWAELNLPTSRYTATLVTEPGADPDAALDNAITKAVTEYAKAQEEAA